MHIWGSHLGFLAKTSQQFLASCDTFKTKKRNRLIEKVTVNISLLLSCSVVQLQPGVLGAKKEAVYQSGTLVKGTLKVDGMRGLMWTLRGNHFPHTWVCTVHTVCRHSSLFCLVFFIRSHLWEHTIMFQEVGVHSYLTHITHELNRNLFV